MDNNTPLKSPYVVDTMGELLRMDIPPRQYILYPFIQEKSLCMLYAKRGTGKTFVGLSIALAVSAGVDIMNFRVEKPHKVLYIDGEMPAQTMQERLSLLAMGLGGIYTGQDNLLILTPDRQDIPMPNLASAEGQQAIAPLLNDVKLLIVDNISALCQYGKENDAESWIPMQKWLLELRRQGIAVLLIDHAGKNGDNRGTSKKQDILDAVIALETPERHKASDGCSFVVRYTKSRCICGEDVSEYEAHLEEDEIGGLAWRVSKHITPKQQKHEETLSKVKELLDKRLTYRVIAQQMGISKSTVGEFAKELSVQNDATVVDSGRTDT